MTTPLILGAKPSVGKRGIDENSALAPKPKKRHVNKAPTSEVIEIESADPPPTGRVITIATTSSLRVASTPPPAPDTPVILPTPLRPSDPDKPLSSSPSITPDKQAPIIAMSRLEPMEIPITTIPTPTSIVPEGTPTSTNPVATTSLSSTTTPNLSTPLSPSIVNPIIEAPPQAAMPSTTGRLSSQSSAEEAAQEGMVTHQSRFNPLTGLKVPKPPFKVPAPPAMTSAPTVVQPVPKKGKLMVPSKTSLTARNLYALDYEKDHSVTNTEFKEIWDNLDAETLKRYEALSKQRKAAMKATSAT
ncbi:uncharacterized protein LACBIDRAFT_312317 [Laccaria bicolor S238N-H82]|uniref:Predicted protein n=1 Tax=Laccaria bicolor (strain S238N-H82 / ATCC MYA-4686) TaxID=486041 RepID=B0DVY3_LACBS|nr:uncharacterized protein LACBIDRAFT_312317 [Laccaria bicolor S238N-H82]EDR01217.1 predicted protein [Laccaria bicolor S238N-H82]|eukprot:XP_001888093.1 predicted protein [Laccaria bicolor S238N-H82]